MPARKVTLYFGGAVADFEIPGSLYADFSQRMPWDRRHTDANFNKAREALAGFMRRDSPETAFPAGANEMLAACFVWNYFNTYPEGRLHIDGDLSIVDLRGDSSAVDYMSAADAQLAHES